MSLRLTDLQKWLPVALLGVIVAVLVVVLCGQIPGDGRWVADLANSAHGPAFAVVTLSVIALMRRTNSGPPGILGEYCIGIALTLLLGALVELLQLVMGRDASLDDFLRDALGTLAATGFLAMGDPRVRALPSRRFAQRSGLLVGVVSTVLVIAPLAIAGTAYLQRHRNFPTLVDFSAPLGRYFLGVYSAVTVERTPLPLAMVGGRDEAVGLHAVLQGDKNWGLALLEPYPDWRGYDRLALELANPTDAVLVVKIRIRDDSQRKNRRAGYLGTITLAPRSRETWTIPLQHLASAQGPAYVNIARVYRLVLTRHPANRAHEFYLMRVWLT